MNRNGVFVGTRVAMELQLAGLAVLVLASMTLVRLAVELMVNRNVPSGMTSGCESVALTIGAATTWTIPVMPIPPCGMQ